MIDITHNEWYITAASYEITHYKKTKKNKMIWSAYWPLGLNSPNYNDNRNINTTMSINGPCMKMTQFTEQLY